MSRKCPSQKDVCRPGYGQSDSQGPLHKKRLGPATKRQLAEELVRDQGVQVSRACKLVSFPRSQSYYSSQRDDKELMEASQELALSIPLMAFLSSLPISEGQVSLGTTKRHTECTSL